MRQVLAGPDEIRCKDPNRSSGFLILEMSQAWPLQGPTCRAINQYHRCNREEEVPFED
jgi:hypothetical protein